MAVRLNPFEFLFCLVLLVFFTSNEVSSMLGSARAENEDPDLLQDGDQLLPFASKRLGNEKAHVAVESSGAADDVGPSDAAETEGGSRHMSLDQAATSGKPGKLCLRCEG